MSKMFPVNKLTEEKKAELRQLCKELNWQEAKTYAKTAPHEYALNFKNDNVKLTKLADAVRDYGVTEYFYNTPTIYLYLDDGYKYFGWKPEEKGKTWFINRASVEHVYGNRND